MLKNYFVVALRRFRRGGTHTAVNVVGLALGLATCALILLLVYNEWSYDRFHANADTIHRVYFEFVNDGEPGVQAMMRPEFTPALTANFPSIERATRFVLGGKDLSFQDASSRHRLAQVDADFFEMFSFPTVAGDPRASIEDPSSIVITTRTATRLFSLEPGSEYASVIGHVVSIPNSGGSQDFRVGAVVEKAPINSSLTFDVAVSFENYDEMPIGGNNSGGRTSTYVQIPRSVDVPDLEAAFEPFTRNEFQEYVEGLERTNRLPTEDGYYALRLQPLTEMHADMRVWLPYEEDAHNPKYSWILAAIGLLILLIACINFVTLSVGQSSIRAREVGVRKVLGATRAQIQRQHWGESIVITIVSLALGLGLAVAARPAFGSLSGVDLQNVSVPAGLVAALVALTILVVGFAAGSYPAAVLGRFQPARVLKGSFAATGQGWILRSLVVLQFTASIGLIACTGIMTKQLRYMLTTDLGFDDDFVLAIDTHQVPRAEADGLLNHFQNQLEPRADVIALSRASNTFTRGGDRLGWVDENGTPRSAYLYSVGHDWFNVLGMEFVEGRSFSREFPGDETNSIVVNQALVDAFDLQEPVGKKMHNWLGDLYDDPPTIIGVVRDFNYASLRNEVAPAIMTMHPGWDGYMGVVLAKIQPNDVAATISAFEGAWKSAFPGKPFIYTFVDEDLARQYSTERRWQLIVTASSILAIVIACLGLFGLAILSVNRRTKEIGIRKVLGASVAGVTALLSREFAILVALASLVATPIAYFAMESWLGSFARQTTVGPWIFIGATLFTMLLAIATVSVHTVRAAAANPVRTLRCE